MPALPRVLPPGPVSPLSHGADKGVLRMVGSALQMWDGTGWVPAVVPAGQLSAPVSVDPSTGVVTLASGLLVAGGITADKLTVSGAISGGSVASLAGISAVGAVSGAALSASGNITTANGTVSGATVASSGNVTAAGNITAVNGSVSGASVASSGNVSAAGDVSGATVHSSGVASLKQLQVGTLGAAHGTNYQSAFMTGANFNTAANTWQNVPWNGATAAGDDGYIFSGPTLTFPTKGFWVCSVVLGYAVVVATKYIRVVSNTGAVVAQTDFSTSIGMLTYGSDVAAGNTHTVQVNNTAAATLQGHSSSNPCIWRCVQVA